MIEPTSYTLIPLPMSIEYTLKRHARARNLKISINPDGGVIVTCPRLTPKFVIDRFVRDHANWITTHQAKMQKNRLAPTDQILLFGKALQVEVSNVLKGKVGVLIETEKLIVTPISDTKDSITKAIQRFFKRTAQSHILERLEILAQQMNITFRQVAFKTQKTRWGSCSSQGNLNFNWRLIHAPREIIDYVIIHELAHRVHMDHSTAFWKLVEKFDPEYRIHRGWLKRQGHHLQNQPWLD